jgi:chromosome partitioning protein
MARLQCLRPAPTMRAGTKRGRMMKVVSVINYKGGVGKTSLTANLGAELAWRGKRVLIIDLDAQASLTFSFIKSSDWSKNYEHSGTIKEWFDSAIAGSPIALNSLVSRPSVINSKISTPGCLDVIYSHLGLINVDLELATMLGGANLSQAKRNFISVHRRLLDGLSPLRATEEYDVVLIDCPPNFNIVTKTAIIASDYILVPTRPDELSVIGIDYLMRSISALIKDYNDYIEVDTQATDVVIKPAMVGVVFTMIQEYGGGPISAQEEYITRVKNNSKLPVFKAYIKRNDTLFASAPAYGIPVVMRAHSNFSHQSVVDGLEAVATEFEATVGV